MDELVDQGGPGKVSLQPDGSFVFAGYNYDHIYKNVWNNWITEPCKELTFTMDGTEYMVCWKDVVAVYEEEQKSPFRHTMLTYSPLFPNLLQRQNVQLVCQVFNDKIKGQSNGLSILHNGLR